MTEEQMARNVDGVAIGTTVHLGIVTAHERLAVRCLAPEMMTERTAALPAAARTLIDVLVDLS
jgi:hypothetical protein